MYTDNPARDWDAYCEEQEQELERLPRCSECHERIYDQRLYDFDGTLICRECLIENHEKKTENYIEY